MNRKPITHWTIDELKKTVARKLDAAKKYQPGPKRQKLLRDAKRYECLLETKKWISSALEPSPVPHPDARPLRPFDDSIQLPKGKQLL